MRRNPPVRDTITPSFLIVIYDSSEAVPCRLTLGRYFDVLLTVHLSVFISIIKQLNAHNLFHNKFISCLSSQGSIWS